MAGYIKIILFLFLLLEISTLNPHISFAVQQMKNVDYTLPYPGLLPDNPLYPLKAIRDRVISFFISDPVRRANFDLLQADKRLNASLYVFNQSHDKETIISNTISKGENYFEEGIGQLREAKSQGEDIHESVKNFTQAGKKHEQILQEMALKVSSNLKKDLNNEENRVNGFEKTLSGMNGK